MGRPLLTILLTVAACTTVDIEERYAFDAKRTVSQAQLDALGYRREQLRIPVGDGLSLDAWHLHRKAGARGTLLYFGGNGHLMVNGYHIMQGILQGPANVLTVDYRGYGQSDGTPSIAALKQDALRVYDHLRSHGTGPEQIVVHGQSLGSFVALWVARRRPVAGVVLETPVSNVEALFGHLAPWWTRAFIRFDIDPKLTEEDNLERISGLTVPLLVLAGETDRVAHPDMARELFDAAPGPDKRLEVLPGGGHNDLPPREDYRGHFRTFLSRVLPEAKTSTGTAPSSAPL